MKPRESYRVTAVRLVEFHNLGTTTVELPEGGHLFLLGDNGSGKTTLLDAIHLVLTAGREMEFNSAARVAGAKDSGGRTYQGVVLRYNAVTGRPARESGITYAALELKSSEGRVLSLAVGLAAEGMDVSIERWGGLARCRSPSFRWRLKRTDASVPQPQRSSSAGWRSSRADVPLRISMTMPKR